MREKAIRLLREGLEFYKNRLDDSPHMLPSAQAYTLWGYMKQALRELEQPEPDPDTVVRSKEAIENGDYMTTEELLGDIRRRKELSGPVANQEYYKPLEQPQRYPLELNDNLHICLWWEDGRRKCTVAYFLECKEGYDLKFVGDRPLDHRVNWGHFRELVVQGQKLADERFEIKKRHCDE